MQKIIPCLWFSNNCEEAINFYINVFNKAPYKNKPSQVISVTRYEKGMNTPGMPQMEGKILTAILELEGERFMALDGGPEFKFNEAVSFYVECKDQEEVDYFWEKLSTDPKFEQCGWLKDKYGVSWQIVPKRLEILMGDKDKTKVQHVINALLEMKKIVVSDLEKAHKKI